MKNIILFGPPGAGKGTQADIIKSKYNFIHVSTGDAFRENISKKTKLGQLAKEFMDKGDLVPDSITIEMLKDILKKKKTDKGYIFDGFPRTISQAEEFDKMLENENMCVFKFISIEVEYEVLVKRLLNRGKESGREDDKNEEIIKHRINEYYKKTNILKDYYKKQNKYKEVNGTEELDTITANICSIFR